MKKRDCLNPMHSSLDCGFLKISMNEFWVITETRIVQYRHEENFPEWIYPPQFCLLSGQQQSGKRLWLDMTSFGHRSRGYLLVVAIVTGEGSGNFHLVTELGVLAPKSTTTYRMRLSGAVKQRAKSATRRLCFPKFLYLFIGLFCILFQTCWRSICQPKLMWCSPFSYSGVSDRAELISFDVYRSFIY